MAAGFCLSGAGSVVMGDCWAWMQAQEIRSAAVASRRMPDYDILRGVSCFSYEICETEGLRTEKYLAKWQDFYY
jgi:hypothetical protein